MFIHLTHGTDDPHRAVMGLRMAELMSEDMDALVHFDTGGVEVVTRDAADIRFKDFPSSRTRLSVLRSRSVILMACPGCLNVAGKAPAGLAAGIQAAGSKVCFSFTKGRVLPLDCGSDCRRVRERRCAHSREP